MLTSLVVAAVLACAAASPWKSDPWPAASQQRPATVPANGDPWPAGNQQRRLTGSNSLNPDDFWWDKTGSNAFDDPAAHPSQVGGSPSHRAPVQRPQVGVSGHQSPRAPAPARAIVSVSSAGSGAPRVTGVRRVSSAVAGGSTGGRVASAAVSSQYIPPAAGSRPQTRPQVQPQPRPQVQPQVYPQTQPRPQPRPQQRPQQRPQPHTSFASASSPSRHQTSISSVSSGSYSAPGSGSYSAPGSGSHSFSSAGRPQPARFTPAQFGGAGSAPVQSQYAGSVAGAAAGSNGAQSPVVKACGASLFCVDTASCDPYTGFLMDPSQGPIPQLDQPTVAFTRCYMNKSRSVGVCCQEPHINDPWTDRTTNGR